MRWSLLLLLALTGCLHSAAVQAPVAVAESGPLAGELLARERCELALNNAQLYEHLTRPDRT